MPNNDERTQTSRVFVSFSDIFWRIYVAFWITYGLGYVVVFASQPNYSLWRAITIAAGCVIPGAFLGFWVAYYYRSALWDKFFANSPALPHVIFAVLFTCVWMLSVLLLESIRLSLLATEWRWAQWRWVEIHWQLFAGLAIYVAIASAAHIEASIKRVLRAERVALQTQSLLARAEKETLLARFSPHFLLNTLHALMALVRSNATLAEEAIEQLGDMLRYIIRVGQAEKTFVLCSEELAFVEQYLAMERLRLGERLVLRLNVSDEVRSVLIPPLLIQPLLENGIKHGISQLASGGELELRISRSQGTVMENQLLIIVENDIQSNAMQAPAMTGVGLDLIRRRLDAQYGNQASFRLDYIGSNRVRAELRLPWTPSS